MSLFSFAAVIEAAHECFRHWSALLSTPTGHYFEAKARSLRWHGYARAHELAVAVCATRDIRRFLRHYVRLTIFPSSALLSGPAPAPHALAWPVIQGTYYQQSNHQFRIGSGYFYDGSCGNRGCSELRF